MTQLQMQPHLRSVNVVAVIDRNLNRFNSFMKFSVLLVANAISLALIGCGPAGDSTSARLPASNNMDVVSRLLDCGFAESKRWDALGTQFVEYKRTDGEALLQATVCEKWTQIAVIVPSAAGDDVDRISSAIRSAESVVELMVADPMTISRLYDDKNLILTDGDGVPRKSSEVISGPWTVSATHYMSALRGADIQTLAMFTLSLN
tara:strand:+ start:20632 stop:21246 length:615 start_codon:yes stop_codon:yes gene_type:complete